MAWKMYTLDPGGDMINSEIEDPEHSYSMYRHDPMSSIRNVIFKYDNFYLK